MFYHISSYLALFIMSCHIKCHISCHFMSHIILCHMSYYVKYRFSYCHIKCHGTYDVICYVFSFVILNYYIFILTKIYLINMLYGVSRNKNISNSTCYIVWIEIIWGNQLYSAGSFILFLIIFHKKILLHHNKSLLYKIC